MPERIAGLVANLVRVSVALVIATVLMLFVLVPSMLLLNWKINNLSTGDTPASVRARQDRAEQRFQLCARSSSIVTQSKRKDIVRSCEGYATLDQAYATQNVPPRVRPSPRRSGVAAPTVDGHGTMEAWRPPRSTQAPD
jgi:hypothetical protein